MEKRPRVQLNVNIEAPNVIVPADPLSNNTNLIVADLGTFAFRYIITHHSSISNHQSSIINQQ
eukprot:1224750-Amorphochlora_amoeboformis.AAC.1